MYQLRSSYNSPFKDSYSYPIHTCFAMFASNEFIESREISFVYTTALDVQSKMHDRKTDKGNGMAVLQVIQYHEVVIQDQ